MAFFIQMRGRHCLAFLYTNAKQPFLTAGPEKKPLFKATGEGLHRPLDSFAVPMGSGSGQYFLTLDEGAATDGCWVFLPLRPARRYTGAVVVGK